MTEKHEIKVMSPDRSWDICFETPKTDGKTGLEAWEVSLKYLVNWFVKATHKGKPLTQVCGDVVFFENNSIIMMTDFDEDVIYFMVPVYWREQRLEVFADLDIEVGEENRVMFHSLLKGE